MSGTGWLPIFQQFRNEVRQAKQFDDPERLDRVCEDYIKAMEEYILNG